MGSLFLVVYMSMQLITKRKLYVFNASGDLSNAFKLQLKYNHRVQ